MKNLDYQNPDHWGRSPLTDSALRLQQIKAENPQQWAAMIEADIQTLNEPPFETYPPFTGTEFLATHLTIDEHPYSVAFGQFLGNVATNDIILVNVGGSNAQTSIVTDVSYWSIFVNTTFNMDSTNLMMTVYPSINAASYSVIKMQH